MQSTESDETKPDAGSDPKLRDHLGLPDPPPRGDAKALPHDDRLDTETAHAPEPSDDARPEDRRG